METARASWPAYPGRNPWQTGQGKGPRMAEQDQDELPFGEALDEDDEDLDLDAVEDLPPEAVEDFNDVQRRHGFDPVVQTRAGRICWE